MLLKLLLSTGLAASLGAGAVAVQLPSDANDSAPTRPPVQVDADAAHLKAKVKATEITRSASLGVGEQEKFKASDAGDATVVRTKAGLKLQLVDPAAGFTSNVERESATAINITFRSADRLIHLVLSLDGANVDIKIITQPLIVIAPDDEAEEAPKDESSDEDTSKDESTDTEEAPKAEEAATTSSSTTTTTEPAADEAETTTEPAGDAGAVQLRSDDTHLVVSDVRVNIGWSYTVVRRTGPETEVVFTKEKFRLRFTARLVDSRIETRVLQDEAQPEDANPPAESTDQPGDEPAPSGGEHSSSSRGSGGHG